jgi:hypothetical protein
MFVVCDYTMTNPLLTIVGKLEVMNITLPFIDVWIAQKIHNDNVKNIKKFKFGFFDITTTLKFAQCFVLLCGWVGQLFEKIIFFVSPLNKTYD